MPLGPGRSVCQTKIGLISLRSFWADRSGLKTATTGRANVVEYVFNAIRAVGAFIAAYTSNHTLRRKITVAKLTVWA